MLAIHVRMYAVLRAGECSCMYICVCGIETDCQKEKMHVYVRETDRDRQT